MCRSETVLNPHATFKGLLHPFQGPLLPRTLSQPSGWCSGALNEPLPEHPLGLSPEPQSMGSTGISGLRPQRLQGS